MEVLTRLKNLFLVVSAPWLLRSARCSALSLLCPCTVIHPHPHPQLQAPVKAFRHLFQPTIPYLAVTLFEDKCSIG
jgi:hypothetical protein